MNATLVSGPSISAASSVRADPTSTVAADSRIERGVASSRTTFALDSANGVRARRRAPSSAAATVTRVPGASGTSRARFG